MRSWSGQVIVLLTFGTLLAGCTGSSQSVSLKDVTKGETLILRKHSSQGHVHGLRIRGTGSISGTAEIRLMQNGSPYKKDAIDGPVEFSWDGDWYADQAEIQYFPKSATAGHLLLDFHFRD